MSYTKRAYFNILEEMDNSTKRLAGEDAPPFGASLVVISQEEPEVSEEDKQFVREFDEGGYV